MNCRLFSIEPKELILRDYQKNAIDLAMRSLGVNKHVVLQLPTGAGKTIIAVRLVKRALRAGKRVAFVCDRLALIDQTSRVFAEYGISHGVIQADHPLTNPYEQVQICSVQTLKNKKENFDFAIIDECHAIYRSHETLSANTEYIMGLTATPWAMGMGKLYNDLVSPVSMRELIDREHLVDFTVYAPATIDTEGLRVVAGDYNKKKMAERADQAKITGDIVKHWFKHAEGLKTICFCVNIAHAKHVAREFNRNGVHAVEINSWQKTDTGERQEIMAKFKTGDALVICSVDILGKGFDYPKVDCIIQARPTQSRMIHVQQVGRGLRNYEGSRPCIILDHAGNHNRLGCVDEQPILELDTGDKNKSENKQKEREQPLPKSCPSCDFLKPASVHKCPACGLEPEHIKDIEVEDGELEEFKKKKRTAKDYSISEKQAWLGGLNAYAKSKGMKCGKSGMYGWAYHKYKEKFGCAPSNKINWEYQCAITQEVANFVAHIGIKYRAERKKEQENTVKVKPILPCTGCGCPDVVERGHDSKHKYALYCAGCGKFNKFGKMSNQC